MLLTVCLAASAFFLFIPGADAADGDEAEYDQDYGAMYGYELTLVFSGSNASKVTWDFGDGSEIAEGMTVTHRYESIGVYIITQTATNDDGVSSTAKYRVEIMGYPQVVYDYGYGGIKMTVTQSTHNNTPELPQTPIRTGYTFDGWYLDPECTTPLNLSMQVTAPLTVYAGWIPADGTVEPDDPAGPGSDDPAGPGSDDPDDPGHSPVSDEPPATLALIIGAVGAVVLGAALYMRRPVIMIIGAAVIALAVLIYMGVLL